MTTKTSKNTNKSIFYNTAEVWVVLRLKNYSSLYRFRKSNSDFPNPIELKGRNLWKKKAIDKFFKSKIEESKHKEQ